MNFGKPPVASTICMETLCLCIPSSSPGPFWLWIAGSILSSWVVRDSCVGCCPQDFQWRAWEHPGGESLQFVWGMVYRESCSTWQRAYVRGMSCKCAHALGSLPQEVFVHFYIPCQCRGQVGTVFLHLLYIAQEEKWYFWLCNHLCCQFSMN